MRSTTITHDNGRWLIQQGAATISFPDKSIWDALGAIVEVLERVNDSRFEIGALTQTVADLKAEQKRSRRITKKRNL